MRLGSTAVMLAMVTLLGCRKEAKQDGSPAAAKEQWAKDSIQAVLDSIADADSMRTPTSLGGTQWRLVEYQSAKYVRTLPPTGTAYTLSFAGDGEVVILADCNRATGMWSSQRKNGLTLSGLGTTTAASCREGTFSEHFLQDLAQAQAYQIVDGRLYVTVTGTGGVYQFQPNDGPPPLSEAVDIMKGQAYFSCEDSTGAALRIIASFEAGQVRIKHRLETTVAARARTPKGHFVGRGVVFDVREHDADLVLDNRSYRCGELPDPE